MTPSTPTQEGGWQPIETWQEVRASWARLKAAWRGWRIAVRQQKALDHIDAALKLDTDFTVGLFEDAFDRPCPNLQSPAHD